MTIETPWYNNFPQPKSKPRSLSNTEIVNSLLNDPSKVPGKDYVIVDVRRTDFEGHMVHGAINIPAHSFYPTRLTWLNILGSIPLVIFYCGSSNGRGPRVAAWYQDTLDEAGVTTSEAIVLAEGIKGFVEKFQDLTDPGMFPKGRTVEASLTEGTVFAE